MLLDIPRISVLMITYKQENLVGRALDSLLSQKDYIYEICINDDYSPDGTWEVLQRYAQQYPDLVKPVRNEHNVGIFENIEATWKRPTGDIIYRLAGDDECGKDYFRQIIEFIKKKHIDYKNELFCIYGDYKELEPDGSFIIYKNALIEKHDGVKLYGRKLLSNRSACYSKKVLDRFEKVSQGRSYNAEIVQEIQVQVFANTNYYIPVVGNIYYAGIGVSKKMNKKEYEERIVQGYQRKIDFLERHGIQIDKKDQAFSKFMKAYRTGNKKEALRYYFSSIDLSLGLYGFQLDRILFVLKKKFRKKSQ